MDNQKFINIHGNAVRKADISVVTEIRPTDKKETHHRRDISYFEFSIMLQGGYPLNIEHFDKRELRKYRESIIKKLDTNVRNLPNAKNKIK